MIIFFNRYSIALSLLFIFGMTTGALGQVIRPETVFRRERIAAGGIVMAKVTTTGRLTGIYQEHYHFNEGGRLTSITTVREEASDTLLSRTLSDERVTVQQEQRRERLRREEVQYDDSGLLIRKVVFVDDTLFSEIHLGYDTAGLIQCSAEMLPGGDTLRSARYQYNDGVLVAIHYRGAAVGRIEYFRQGGYNVSRAFSPEGELMMTRTEKYRRNRLLKRETLSVPGIGVTPPIVYRYRFGLLRKILHPDGSKSRVQYFRNNK